MLAPDDEPEKPKCSRTLRGGKYEKNSPEIQNWWFKLFDMMEADAAIPPDKRLNVLNEIFPTKLLERILSILKLDLKRDDTAAGKKAGAKHSTDRGGACDDSLQSFAGNLDDKKNRQEIGANNPYTSFFNCRPDRAAIWHTLPPLSYDEMNLSQKAAAITEAIASDFVKWMGSVKEKDSSEGLTVPDVLKIFEIGFNTHAAQSLQVRIREMLTIPTGVALLKSIPEMQKRSQTLRLILANIAASEETERVFAFGTRLPAEDQVLPPKKAEVGKWMSCSRVPVKLQTMAVVFQGITHLKSTRVFCEYLNKKPLVKKPQFLVDSNMFDPLVLKQSDHAFEIEPEIDRISQFSNDPTIVPESNEGGIFNVF